MCTDEVIPYEKKMTILKKRMCTEDRRVIFKFKYSQIHFLTKVSSSIINNVSWNQTLMTKRKFDLLN
jgi:hypothetical protein